MTAVAPSLRKSTHSAASCELEVCPYRFRSFPAGSGLMRVICKAIMVNTFLIHVRKAGPTFWYRSPPKASNSPYRSFERRCWHFPERRREVSGKMRTARSNNLRGTSQMAVPAGFEMRTV